MTTPFPILAPNIRSKKHRIALEGQKGLMKKITFTQCQRKNFNEDAPRSNSDGLNLDKSDFTRSSIGQK